jgi:HSP20 family protein
MRTVRRVRRPAIRGVWGCLTFRDYSLAIRGVRWRISFTIRLQPGGALERWFGDFSSSRFQPRIDVVDEGKILRVTVELPGMEREDLNVSVEDGALVLRGEKRQDVRSEEDGCYRLERAYGAFTRTIPMPENADADHALAKFDKGVLTLTVPKQEASQSASYTIDIG